MAIGLRPVRIPDFGVPLDPPAIPTAVYEARNAALYARAGAEWVVVYADREHLANMAFLTGFEPRFEEALFLLGPGGRRVLVVGNEGQSYTSVARLPGIEISLCQSMSLLGQDRRTRPNLAVVLKDVGIKTG